MECLDQLEAAVANGRGDAVIVKPLDPGARAVEDPILYIMATGAGIRSDNKDFMAQFFQPFLQDFDMGDHAVYIWEISFGEKSNAQRKLLLVIVL